MITLETKYFLIYFSTKKQSENYSNYNIVQLQRINAVGAKIVNAIMYGKGNKVTQ